MSDKSERVQAVDRALSILKVFGPGRTALTLTAIARETGLYKSTILRLASSLEQNGFLERGSDLVYRPGRELWRLGVLHGGRLDLADVVRPVLDTLVTLTGETASFYARDGEERVCLYRANSPRPVRHHLDEGTRFPLRQGAAGHILAGFATPHEKEYRALRAKGYYVSLGERDPEVGAVAVPVIDAAGRLRGALSVSGILARFDEPAQAKARDALIDAAAALSSRLPYS